MMSLHSRLTAQHLPNYSNANDITNDLESLNFEHGLNEYEMRYKKLRVRHHAMTIMSVAHATYMVSVLNRVRQMIAEKKQQREVKAVYNKTRARDPIKVGIIGCGRLGKQIVSSLLYFSDVRPSELIISTRQPDKLDNLQQAGITCVHDNRMVAQNCDLIFLCFSPSSLVTVVEEIQGHIRANSLVFSFLAAVRLGRLKSTLKYEQIATMDLKWTPKSLDAPWTIGNDVISALLDSATIKLCCPTLKRDGKHVIEAPMKSVEVVIYHMINMLSHLPPKEIISLVNNILVGKVDNFEISWEHLLTTEQIKQLKESKGQLPHIQIGELFSSPQPTPLKSLMEQSDTFLYYFKEQFSSVFSRLYHKPTDE